MIEGGCNCGAIRYRAEGDPIVVAQCHCTNCRKQSGSAFSVNLLFKAAAISQDGDLTVYEDQDTFSGNPVLRKFCGRCGSPIFSETTDGKGLLIVKAGTLDDPSAFAPTVSVWKSTALPWVTLPEGQYSFEKTPDAAFHGVKAQVLWPLCGVAAVHHDLRTRHEAAFV